MGQALLIPQGRLTLSEEWVWGGVGDRMVEGGEVGERWLVCKINKNHNNNNKKEQEIELVRYF